MASFNCKNLTDRVWAFSFYIDPEKRKFKFITLGTPVIYLFSNTLVSWSSGNSHLLFQEQEQEFWTPDPNYTALVRSPRPNGPYPQLKAVRVKVWNCADCFKMLYQSLRQRNDFHWTFDSILPHIDWFLIHCTRDDVT